GADGVARLWDAGTGKEKFTLRGQAGAGFAVGLAPAGKTPASGKRGGAGKWGGAGPGGGKGTLPGQLEGGWSRAVSGGGENPGAGGTDTAVKLWDLGGLERDTFPGHTDAFTALAVAPDGKTLAVGSVDNSVQLLDATTGAVRRTLKGHDKP